MIEKELSSENVEIHHLQVEGLPSQAYLLLLPHGWDINSNVLVCVHGISRKYQLQIELLKSQALKNRMILIAPYFSIKYHPSYQRHEVGLDGMRSDEVLNNIIVDVNDKFSLEIRKFSLFGFSAGAQFSHRYSIRYPHKIRKLILCASGWYTFPSLDLPFPHGFGDNEKKHFILNGKNEYNLKHFLQIPITIAIGEEDKVIDSSLNTSKKVNIKQGYDRVSRAINWTNSLVEESQKRSINSKIKFILLQNSGHSFTECIKFGNLNKYIFD